MNDEKLKKFVNGIGELFEELDFTYAEAKEGLQIVTFRLNSAAGKIKLKGNLGMASLKCNIQIDTKELAHEIYKLQKRKDRND